MAKPNTFASPPRPSGDQDSVEIDRFPPRRGNPKEKKRTIAVLVGAIITLTVGVGLRATVFAPRYNNAPLPPEVGVTESEPLTSGNTRSYNDAIPVGVASPAPVAGTSPRAGGPLSPFDDTSSPAVAASPGANAAITGAYNPFASSGSGVASPAPAASPAPLPGTVTKPGGLGTVGSGTTSVEPPIIPSLSQTGGVYKPTLPPPAPGTVNGGLNNGLNGGIGGTTGTTGTGGAGGRVTGGTPPGSFGAPASGTGTSGSTGSGGLYVAPR